MSTDKPSSEFYIDPSYKQTEDLRAKWDLVLNALLLKGVKIWEEFPQLYSHNPSKILLSILIRRFLDTLDGVRILISNGSVDNANPLLRIMIELLMDVKYILSGDVTQKAETYFAFQIIKEDQRFQKYLADGDEAYERLVKGIKKELLFTLEISNDVEEVKMNIDGHKKHYEAPGSIYNYIYNEYMKKMNQYGGPQLWYSLFKGPDKIHKLAKEVGLTMTYEYFYSEYSSATHGRDYLGNFFAPNDHEVSLAIRGIRKSSSVSKSAVETIAFSLRMYVEVCHIMSEETVREFDRWVLNDFAPLLKQAQGNSSH